MGKAIRDENQIPGLLATSNADGVTPVPVTVDPSTQALGVSNGTSGSDLSGDIASRDENGVPVFMGVSSADGVTPVPIYADPATGKILIKTT